MTWAPVTPGFGLDHLPYGRLSIDGAPDVLAVRVGDHALDLTGLASGGRLPPVCQSLDALMAAGADRWEEVRSEVITLLTAGSREHPEQWLVPLASCTLRLPFAVADFVDFYSSEAHASNVGRMFRPESAPLLENWKHMPVGYHGRSGTVVVSGTPLPRPSGQWRAGKVVDFGPSRKLDFELEVGFVVGTPSNGPISPASADGHLFGVVLLNDWSARDIQAWEYVPLGPFLGKSFMTTVSAWVTPMAALAPYRVPAPVQDAVLDHLADGRRGIDLDLTASISSDFMRDEGIAPFEVSRTSFADMYWTAAQQVAHLTSNGATLRTGDLLGSGTVSGWSEGTFGSLLEASWNGTREIRLPDGTTRTFLRDGDEVVLSGRAGTIVLGEARGVVV